MEERPDEVLNLAIDAAQREQSCTFCSIKETAPAEDGGDRALARLLADLVSNRQRGVRKVRINGYDPLGFSRIVELLRRTKDLGYTEAHGFPPCTRLSDSAFCNEMLDSLPDVKRFHVPLYSTRADVHDRIVGRMGAFDLVMRALDNLLARLAPRDVWISARRNERCARGNRRIGTFCIGAGARISSAHALPQLRVASRSLLFCGAGK